MVITDRSPQTVFFESLVKAQLFTNVFKFKFSHDTRLIHLDIIRHFPLIPGATVMTICAGIDY